MEKLKIKTVSVSEKGQIALPIEIRQELDIQKGDKLILVQTDNKLLIEKAEIISKEIRDEFKDILRLSELSLKEVWGNKQDDIWKKYLKK